jgi:hypothetical protein
VHSPLAQRLGVPRDVTRRVCSDAERAQGVRLLSSARVEVTAVPDRVPRHIWLVAHPDTLTQLLLLTVHWINCHPPARSPPLPHRLAAAHVLHAAVRSLAAQFTLYPSMCPSLGTPDGQAPCCMFVQPLSGQRCITSTLAKPHSQHTPPAHVRCSTTLLRILSHSAHPISHLSLPRARDSRVPQGHGCLSGRARVSCSCTMFQIVRSRGGSRWVPLACYHSRFHFTRC